MKKAIIIVFGWDEMMNKKHIGKNGEVLTEQRLYGRSHRFIDLNVITCGHEQCAPTKFVDVAKKDVFTIHAIESGKGYIEFNGNKVQLSTNDVFFIYPGEMVSYYPDPKSPWSYFWMTFEGVQAEELVGRILVSPEKPYIKNDSNRKLLGYFAAAMEAFERNGKIVAECVGYLYIILGAMAGKDEEALPVQQRYVKEALTFIYYNFNFDITVKDIAKNLHISPNYLSSLFQEEVGMTTKQYLIKTRMERALRHMQQNHEVKIKDVAAMVGYEDPLYFSKVFRGYYGKTPKEAMEAIQLVETRRKIEAAFGKEQGDPPKEEGKEEPQTAQTAEEPTAEAAGEAPREDAPKEEGAQS